MLKVFTYYDDSVKDFFTKSLISLASAFSEETIDLIVIVKNPIPKKISDQLKKVFVSITQVSLSGKHYLEKTSRSVDQLYFTDYLIEYTEYDRMFVDPNLFFLKSFKIPKDTSLFFRQHRGKLSTKLCYLKAGDYINRAFYAFKRGAASTVTDDEFTVVVANNYLIPKIVSPDQIISGKLLNESAVSSITGINAVAIDTHNIGDSPNNTVNSMINLESRRNILRALSYIKTKKKEAVVKDLGLSESETKIFRTNTLSNSVLVEKIPFSIILSAYQTQDFIEECLDSIKKQTYFENNNQYEILVGVDGCSTTLKKLLEIQHKYQNLIIHVMRDNKGLFMTTNALLNLVKYENVIRFDTDDIMETTLIAEVANFKKLNDVDIIKLGYSDWKKGEKISDHVQVNDGIIYFKKSVMDNLAGGYMPWDCAADSELIARLIDKVKISSIPKRLFIRRLHDNNLTVKSDTNYNSTKRKNYVKQIKRVYSKDEVKIERICNEIEYSVPNSKGFNKINILLVADSIGWAFDHLASAIIKYNPYPDKIYYEKTFIRELRKSGELINLDAWDYIYVMWEGESYVPNNTDKIIRGCYSARWLELGGHTQSSIADTFLKNRAGIFVNEFLQAEISKYLPTDFKSTVIYDSSDESIFYPIPSAKNENFTAIFVGNTNRKIKNFNIIKEICAEVGIDLIVASNIPYNELVYMYNKADICINFSDFEGGPQTFAESALCSIPMIIRDNNRLSRKIPCFTGKTKEDFIKLLLHLKNNRHECVSKGKLARKTVLKNFTYKTAAKQYSDFFLSLAAKPILSDLTVFIISAGNNPNYEDCKNSILNQTTSFELVEIKNVAPMSLAYQTMLDSCKTKYYVQVDEDMILTENAISTMYKAMKLSSPNTAMVAYFLHDVHFDYDILGVKIANHKILKQYPRWTKEKQLLDADQNALLKNDGYLINIENEVLGQHSPKWTNELIFNRYWDLSKRFKKYKYTWLDNLPEKLFTIFKNDPSDLNFCAWMGALMSMTELSDTNLYKNFKIKNKQFSKLSVAMKDQAYKYSFLPNANNELL